MRLLLFSDVLLDDLDLNFFGFLLVLSFEATHSPPQSVFMPCNSFFFFTGARGSIPIIFRKLVGPVSGSSAMTPIILVQGYLWRKSDVP